jgi:hypothetical protein
MGRVFAASKAMTAPLLLPKMKAACSPAAWMTATASRLCWLISKFWDCWNTAGVRAAVVGDDLEFISEEVRDGGIRVRVPAGSRDQQQRRRVTSYLEVQVIAFGPDTVRRHPDVGLWSTRFPPRCRHDRTVLRCLARGLEEIRLTATARFARPAVRRRHRNAKLAHTQSRLSVLPRRPVPVPEQERKGPPCARVAQAFFSFSAVR